MRKKRKRLTRRVNNNLHHICPKSRGGMLHGNTVELPTSVHIAWHTLFDNLTVREAHIYIDIIMKAGWEWDEKNLKLLRNMIKCGQHIEIMLGGKEYDRLQPKEENGRHTVPSTTLRRNSEEIQMHGLQLGLGDM